METILFALYEKLKKVLIIGLFLCDNEERFLLMECFRKLVSNKIEILF
jgi:hypothetical protein